MWSDVFPCQSQKTKTRVFVTPISASGYKIIDSSMLEKLISTSRSSFCKNWILQLRQDNKKRKTVCETLLLYLKSFGKTLKTAATNHVVYNSNRSQNRLS